MALEEIINSGKEDNKARKIVGTFRENPYLNISQILESAGDNVQEFYDNTGHDAEDFLGLTPAQVNIILGQRAALAQSSLIQEVQNDYSTAVNALGEDDDGRNNIAKVLRNVEPVNFGSGDLKDAHKEAYDLNVKISEDPKRAYAESLEPYRETSIGLAASLLAENNPRLIEVALNRRLGKSIAKLHNEMGDIGGARNYITGVYESSEDEQKAGIAYSVGRKVTDLAGNDENNAA